MIARKNSEHHDPKEITKYLIKTYGVDEAIVMAKNNVADASSNDDLYALSIWRDVRARLLKHQPDKSEIA